MAFTPLQSLGGGGGGPAGSDGGLATTKPGVVFVSQNGYAGTPEVGNPFKPYQTLHAGMLAAILGGHSKIEVAEGTYTFQPADPTLPIFNGDIFSQSATIVGNGLFPAIGDTNGVTCRFLGQWKIQNAAAAIRLSQACTLIIEGDVTSGNVVQDTIGSTLDIRGNVSANSIIEAGELIVSGSISNVTCTDSTADVGRANGLVSVENGFVTIREDCSAIVTINSGGLLQAKGTIATATVNQTGIGYFFGNTNRITVDQGEINVFASVIAGGATEAITVTGALASIVRLNAGARLIANAAAAWAITVTTAATIVSTNGCGNKDIQGLGGTTTLEGPYHIIPTLTQ